MRQRSKLSWEERALLGALAFAVCAWLAFMGFQLMWFLGYFLGLSGTRSLFKRANFRRIIELQARRSKGNNEMKFKTLILILASVTWGCAFGKGAGHSSAKAVSADRANLAAARSAASAKRSAHGDSASQKSAARANLVAARNTKKKAALVAGGGK